jgi:DNA invertase Pin-like site-specific DNA recombinase
VPGDTVVVPGLAHLAASLPQLVERLADLGARGVRLETLSGELDADNPAVAAALAALHAFALRARPVRLSAAAPAGRPRQMSEADTARARQLIEAGKRTIRDLASEFGVSRATLYRSLKDRT